MHMYGDDKRVKVVIELELSEDTYAGLKSFADGASYTTSRAADELVFGSLQEWETDSRLHSALTPKQYNAYHAEQRAVLAKYTDKSKSKTKKK